MDAIELLESQHREVEDLFAEIEEAQAYDEKSALFAEIADRLAIHATIEERHFYPAVRDRPTEDILLESLQEHMSIKRALVDLLDLDPSEDAFEEKLQTLKREVEHHVAQEERDLFPKVKRILDSEERDAIGQAMMATALDLEEQEPREAVRVQMTEAPHFG